MPGRGGGADDRSGLTAAGNDAAQLVIDYAKQETVGPIQALGRFVGWGAVGSMALSVGLVLLLLALLRFLQGETDAFHGNLSWVPYLIVAVVAVLIMGLAGWRVYQGAARRHGPPPTKGSPS